MDPDCQRDISAIYQERLEVLGHKWCVILRGEGVELTQDTICIHIVKMAYIQYLRNSLWP